MAQINEYRCDTCGVDTGGSTVGWWGVTLVRENDHKGDTGKFECESMTWDVAKASSHHFCSLAHLVSALSEDGVLTKAIFLLPNLIEPFSPDSLVFVERSRSFLTTS